MGGDFFGTQESPRRLSLVQPELRSREPMPEFVRFDDGPSCPVCHVRRLKSTRVYPPSPQLGWLNAHAFWAAQHASRKWLVSHRYRARACAAAHCRRYLAVCNTIERDSSSSAYDTAPEQPAQETEDRTDVVSDPDHHIEPTSAPAPADDNPGQRADPSSLAQSEPEPEPDPRTPEFGLTYKNERTGLWFYSTNGMFAKARIMPVRRQPLFSVTPRPHPPSCPEAP